MRLTALFIAVSIAFAASSDFVSAQPVAKTDGAITSDDLQYLSTMADSCEAFRIQMKIARIDRFAYQAFMHYCFASATERRHLHSVTLPYLDGNHRISNRHETIAEATEVCNAYVVVHGLGNPMPIPAPSSLPIASVIAAFSDCIGSELTM